MSKINKAKEKKHIIALVTLETVWVGGSGRDDRSMWQHIHQPKYSTSTLVDSFSKLRHHQQIL